MVKFGFQNEKGRFPPVCLFYRFRIYPCIRQPYTAKKKNGPKHHPRLIHESKTGIKKISAQIFCVTIVYLNENCKIKEKFFKKILIQK